MAFFKVREKVKIKLGLFPLGAISSSQTPELHHSCLVLILPVGRYSPHLFLAPLFNPYAFSCKEAGYSPPAGLIGSAGAFFSSLSKAFVGGGGGQPKNPVVWNGKSGQG